MDGRKNKFKIFLLGYLCKVFPWDYTCRELCFSVSSALEMLIEKATAGILTNDRSLAPGATVSWRKQRGSSFIKSSFIDSFIQQIIVEGLPCAKSWHWKYTDKDLALLERGNK